MCYLQDSTALRKRNLIKHPHHGRDDDEANLHAHRSLLSASTYPCLDLTLVVRLVSNGAYSSNTCGLILLTGFGSVFLFSG
jgi:hypothetical protein